VKIRSVRPEFFTDVRMAQLSFGARLLYVGLWSYVDDEGRGEFLPKRIEGEVFPNESVDFAGLWSELERMGRVVVYVVGEQSYFHIPTFSAYQKPNRVYASRLPAQPVDSADAVRTQRVDSVDAPPVEGAVEGEGEAAAASDSFRFFHKQRARSEVTRRVAQGRPVQSETGLVYTLEHAADFTAESQRIWDHQDCSTCGGTGFEDFHSPGSGGVTINCRGNP
jgi:hypothetical protein